MNIGALTRKYITTPIKKFRNRNNIDTLGAIRTYNVSMRMLVDDFSGKQSVPNCNLKAVYDTLMIAYSQILASRRIAPNIIKALKKRGVAGMEWAHIARLSESDQKYFIKNLSSCPKTKMVQQAAFKNNANKFMTKVLDDKKYRPLLQEAGINIKQFKEMLKTGQGDLFNLDIIKNPLMDMSLESEQSIGLRMIRRIVNNERNTKISTPDKLLPCFYSKILNKNYKFPDFFPQLDYYRNAHGYLTAGTDKYLDAFDRFKVLDMVDAKIRGVHVGVSCKQK